MMSEIERMKREIEEIKASPDYGTHKLDKFLPLAFSAVLAEQIEPVLPILVMYAHLVQKAGKTLPIDTTKLKRYKDDSSLLRHSEGTLLRVYGVCVYGAINTIEKAVRGDISASKVARSIYTYMSFIKDFRSTSDFYNDAVYDEYKRLKGDLDLFEEQRNEYITRGERNDNDN